MENKNGQQADAQARNSYRQAFYEFMKHMPVHLPLSEQKQFVFYALYKSGFYSQNPSGENET